MFQNMNKLCNDELRCISEYIGSDKDFMNFRRTSHDTYTLKYGRDI